MCVILYYIERREMISASWYESADDCTVTVCFRVSMWLYKRSEGVLVMLSFSLHYKFNDC
jgi:hypothetical protein